MGRTKKINKEAIGLIRGLMTTSDRPIRPIRACRSIIKLKDISKHTKAFSSGSSLPKGTFNNLQKGKCFEFRETLRDTCPKCYAKMTIKNLKVNILDNKDSTIYKIKGLESIGGFRQYAIAAIDSLNNKKNGKDTVYADITTYQLHGIGLAPCFITVNCPDCVYHLHIFNEGNFPEKILKFKRKIVNKTIKISPKIKSFKNSQKVDEKPNFQLTINWESYPKIVFNL